MLGTPPAFILSQDQTLSFISLPDYDIRQFSHPFASRYRNFAGLSLSSLSLLSVNLLYLLGYSLLFSTYSRKVNLLSSEFSLALFFFRIIKEFFRVCVLTNVMFSRFLCSCSVWSSPIILSHCLASVKNFFIYFFEALFFASLPAASASLFCAAVFAAVVRIIYAFIFSVKHFFYFFYFISFFTLFHYMSCLLFTISCGFLFCVYIF